FMDQPRNQTNNFHPHNTTFHSNPNPKVINSGRIDTKFTTHQTKTGIIGLGGSGLVPACGEILAKHAPAKYPQPVLLFLMVVDRESVCVEQDCRIWSGKSYVVRAHRLLVYNAAAVICPRPVIVVSRARGAVLFNQLLLL
ncbi:hypothetical protein, partial [Sulfitobacter sp.]|uniref:hypothetical protein n=1 Tax=Sulfitobacter sp. TaxID=1903071 RepID=UPI003296BD7B